MQLEHQPDRGDFSPLEDQIRECFGRVVYTHKTHEKMADRCSATLQCVSAWNIDPSGGVIGVQF